jgi:hypothetical protein
VSSHVQPVQGRGAAAAVAAVGGRSLAALPIIEGLLARVPAEEAPDQLSAGPTPPTTPPRPAATGPTTAHPR